MITEIINKEGYPWILFTAENNDDWLELIRLRDKVYDFEAEDCIAEYEVKMFFDEVARQFSIQLDHTNCDEEKAQWAEYK